MPAKLNIPDLYSERTVIHGAAPMRPAKDAPIPSVTSNAGRAQQTKVVALVNKLKIGRIVCLYKLFIIRALIFVV